MACCAREESYTLAKKRNKEINKILKEDGKQYRSELRLLLLGAGESGKSTIIKQMQIIHGEGFEKGDQTQYKLDIIRNVIVNMAAILNAMSGGLRPLTPAIEFDNSLVETAKEIRAMAAGFSDNAVDRARVSQQILPILKEPQSLANKIANLWKDPGVQQCFHRSNEYQLNDTAEYLFNRLPELVSGNFAITNQDVVHSRNQTSGISEFLFRMESHSFRIVDVGGQRQERHKWIQCFTDVTAVIWVVATSGFDQTLREDTKMNRLSESLKLFDELWKNRFLKKISVILFLNKKDLLEKKMKRNGSEKYLANYFPDYDGGPSVKDARKFMLAKFDEIAHKNKNEVAKNLYSHFTCAVDTGNIRRVFDACKDIIIRLNLGLLGLV